MTVSNIDLIIIADKGKYENIAFNMNLTELSVENEVMTIQNLKNFFGKKIKGEDYQNIKANIDLTETGKLNGIYLYNFSILNDLKTELINNCSEEALESFSNYNPTCVALSTTWFNFKSEVKIVIDRIRKFWPQSYIIVGGPLIYNSYLIYTKINSNYDTQSCKNNYFFLDDNDHITFKNINQFVIEQQGEKELIEICYALKNNKDPKTINNTAFYHRNELHFNTIKDNLVNLDQYYIDWSKLPNHIVPEILPLQLSTGCPYKCNFCNFVPRKRILKKSKEIIRKELISISKLKKVKHIRIVDDTMSTSDLKNFCSTKLEINCDIPWTTFARADSINEEIPSKLKESHCTSVQLGLESGDDTILKNMNKKASTELYRKVLHRLAQAGITTRATFIMGFPGETPETVKNTINFINNLDYSGEGRFEFSFAPFFLLPLSPIYEPEKRAEFGLEGYLNKWKHNTMDSNEVLKLMQKAFFSINDDKYFAYAADDIMPDLSNEEINKIKSLRQKARKIQLLNNDIIQFNNIINQIEKIFLKYL